MATLVSPNGTAGCNHGPRKHHYRDYQSMLVRYFDAMAGSKVWRHTDGMPTIIGWLFGMVTLPAVPVCTGWARCALPPHPVTFAAVGRWRHGRTFDGLT